MEDSAFLYIQESILLQHSFILDSHDGYQASTNLTSHTSRTQTDAQLDKPWKLLLSKSNKALPQSHLTMGYFVGAHADTLRSKAPN
jgi:hypothetical protein